MNALAATVGNPAALFAAVAFPAPVVNGAEIPPGFLNLINVLFGSPEPETETPPVIVMTVASPKQIAQALIRSMFKVEKELESIDVAPGAPVSVNTAPAVVLPESVVPQAPNVRRDLPVPAGTDLKIAMATAPPAELAFSVRLTPREEPLPDGRGSQGFQSRDREEAVRPNVLSDVPVKDKPVFEIHESAAVPVQNISYAPMIETAPTPPIVTSKADAPFTSVTQALSASEPIATPPPAPVTTPVQEIAVRITRPEQPPVDVHLIERAGQIHVDVRTPDAALQVTLRHDLGTLAGSLDRAGYHAEIFSPKDTVAAMSSSSEMSFKDDRSSSEGRQQQQQQQSRDHRPWRWLEDQEKES